MFAFWRGGDTGVLCGPNVHERQRLPSYSGGVHVGLGVRPHNSSKQQQGEWSTVTQMHVGWSCRADSIPPGKVQQLKLLLKKKLGEHAEFLDPRNALTLSPTFAVRFRRFQIALYPLGEDKDGVSVGNQADEPACAI
jgi:hypothetical protein